MPVFDAVLLGVCRVDIEGRLGAELAHRGHVAVLGVEELPVALAGGEHERILLVELRRRDRALGRLLEIRQVVVAERAQKAALQLDLAGHRVEPGLSVGAQLAGLVTAVALEVVLIHHVLELGPGARCVILRQHPIEQGLHVMPRHIIAVQAQG